MKYFSRTALVLAACVLPCSVQGPSLAVANPEPEGTRLNLTRSATNATLSWPLPDANVVLEWATNINSTDWQTVSEMLTISNSRCEVTVALNQGQCYFRLSKRGSDGPGAPAPQATNGFITAVLRSACTSAPTPPPPVGETVVGPDYVIMTVADGDPLDYAAAQNVVTDAVFESLMPLYCGLPPLTNSCVTNRVQWNLVTYDAGGNPRISGSPTSGAGFHYCQVTNGYIIAVVGGESASLPSPPPVGQVAVGADSVIMTIADGDPTDLVTAQSLATEAIFESLMRQYCALPRGTGNGQASGRARWKVATYDTSGNPQLSACAASGCDFHECVVSRGFITAVLRSECTSAPTSPPPVGGITVGPDYVIMTVADGDPSDYEAAQRVVTDAVFESLMPLYCGVPGLTNSCVTNRVQWNLLTYDAGGNPRISGGPTSGHGFHYCRVTNGSIVAIVGGESASLPSPPPVGQVAVGADSVIMTLVDGDPMNLEAAQRLATDAVFESLMRRYCALPRGTGDGHASGRARWKVATYDAGGNRQLSACATSGCDFHACAVSRGYITAVLRSECTSAPTPPPPVGETVVGPDYVIMTVADGDPLDYEAAQRVVTDAIFESLMPLYCALARNPTAGCVRNRVQWNLLTYDAGGNPMISGSPTSGPGLHSVGPCSP